MKSAQNTMKIRGSAKRSKGITLLEYAIIAGLIAAVAIAIISALGGKVNNSFETINSNWNR